MTSSESEDEDDVMDNTEHKTDNDLVLDPENVIVLNGGGEQNEGSKQEEVRYASMTGNRGTCAWVR